METRDRTRKQSRSCGGVVWRVKEGKLDILLIKQFHNSNRWGIPKGHQHENETLEDCAKREIREETGVEVVLGERLQNMYLVYGNEDKTVCSWLARVTGDDEPHHDDPDSEVHDARWFSASELPDILVYQRDHVKGAIATLLAMTGAVPIEHDRPD